MLTKLVLVAMTLAGTGAVLAQAAPASPATPAAPAAGPQAAAASPEQKSTLGMSILGNQEAPKALVIVPWKSSQLGDAVGLSRTLDDGRQPVDKEVFMRQLRYYEIRAKAK